MMTLTPALALAGAALAPILLNATQQTAPLASGEPPPKMLSWLPSLGQGTGLPGDPDEADRAARGVTLECAEKYCPPIIQIMVDNPKETLGTDQSLGVGLAVEPMSDPAPSLYKLYESGKQRHFRIAHQHPGVRLVAHSVS